MHHLILVDSEELQYVVVPLMTNSECKDYGNVTNNMICAGGEKDSCYGDAGNAIDKPYKWLILRLTKELSESANCKAFKKFSI